MSATRRWQGIGDAMWFLRRLEDKPPKRRTWRDDDAACSRGDWGENNYMTGIQARYVIEQEMARRLTPGEELAIRLRYGLDGTPPMTLLEVGIRLGGMSKDGVRGLILRALRKLARPSWRGDLRRIR